MPRDSDPDVGDDVKPLSHAEVRQLASAFDRLLRAVLDRPHPAFARVRKLWLDRARDAERQNPS